MLHLLDLFWKDNLLFVDIVIRSGYSGGRRFSGTVFFMGELYTL